MTTVAVILLAIAALLLAQAARRNPDPSAARRLRLASKAMAIAAVVLAIVDLAGYIIDHRDDPAAVSGELAR